MTMFDWLFGRKKQRPSPRPIQFSFPEDTKENESDFRPPSEKQKNYARKLKIAFTPDASREELSALIAEAEEANPSLRQEREQAKVRQREKKYGAELIDAEQKWEQLSKENKWLVAVYKSGKNINAELLRINGAFIEENGTLKVEAEVGKVIKDKDLGNIVDLGRYVALDISKLLWSQIIDTFELKEVDRFSRTLKHAEQIAEQLARQGK